MAKGLSKERVIDTALALLDIDGMTVNFRDIARKLNCAHTNLYNYFDSFEALLWEAQEEIMQRLQNKIEESLGHTALSEEKLAAFWDALIDFYLLHKGWFHLVWFEPIHSPRPKAHYDRTVSMVDAMVEALTAAFEHAESESNALSMRMNLHNINAYILGELSIYLAGRGLIREEATFRAYVSEQATRMMWLLAGDKQ